MCIVYLLSPYARIRPSLGLTTSSPSIIGQNGAKRSTQRTNPVRMNPKLRIELSSQKICFLFQFRNFLTTSHFASVIYKVSHIAPFSPTTDPVIVPIIISRCFLRYRPSYTPFSNPLFPSIFLMIPRNASFSSLFPRLFVHLPI